MTEYRAQFTKATTGIEAGVTIFRVTADGELTSPESVDLAEGVTDLLDATLVLYGIGWDIIEDWDVDDAGTYWATLGGA